MTSAGLVSSCAPRLSHTPPHDFVLSSPMQPQTHQYYAPQYNPLHYQQQQQPRFDFTHPLEPFQAAHSSQFGNGPTGFHPVSAGGAHQPLTGPTHPQPSQHQARHPLRARSEVEALQQVHMNQFAGAAMEHARRSREELYSAVRRPDMFDMIGPGNIQESQVKYCVIFFPFSHTPRILPLILCLKNINFAITTLLVSSPPFAHFVTQHGNKNATAKNRKRTFHAK